MKKQRKSIRLPGYDYGSEGWYFVTICSFEFEEIFGEIDSNGNFEANDVGKIINEEWLKTETVRPNVFLDEYQLMPNHLHGIIGFGSREKLPNIGVFPNVSNETTKFESPKKNLGAVIRGFKGASVNKLKTIIENKIWQGNYYERIIRDKEELNKIRKYIMDNPKNWFKDKERFKILLLKMSKK